jgi:hypothetical protein
MRFIHYFINLVFGFALVGLLLSLCLFTWQIGQISTLIYLSFICLLALIIDNLKKIIL